MKVAIGGDHAGFSYKKNIISHLQSKGYEVKDFGPFSEASVDFPDFAHPVASAVEKKEFDFGILICGSGNGVAMSANKHSGIRAALVWNTELASLARQHNNANVLCLPSRFIDYDLAISCIEKFFSADFEGGRHVNRVDKISHC
jgi:ribose 5-phosphate isomerase B